MRLVLFLLAFLLLLNPGFAMEDDGVDAPSSSAIRKGGGSEEENDEDYNEIPREEFELKSFTILRNPELGVEYTSPFTKNPHSNHVNSYNQYIHGWLEINLEGEGEKLLEKIMGTLVGPNQVIIPSYHLKDLSTWNPSKITFYPVRNEQDAADSFVEAFSDDVIVFNDGQIEKITSQKGEKLPSNGACIFFLKEAIGNKTGYAGLGAVSDHFLKTQDVCLGGAIIDETRVRMYREKSSITETGKNFFEIGTRPTPNWTNEILFSQLPNTPEYSVIGYAGAQPHIFQRFTTSSLNKLVEALNSSPNSKRPPTLLPALRLGPAATDYYGAIKDFSIVLSEESAAPLTSAKGKVPTRDFPLEYSEAPGKALEGNLRRWAYIYVEDQTRLRPLFLLMKAASTFHPLVTNMIPQLFEFYYDPNNLKLLNGRLDLETFYNTGLAQLSLSLASTIQQAGLDPSATDIEKKLNLFPADQREFWKFIIEPFQLQARMKKEFTRWEQEAESGQEVNLGNLKSLFSLALCRIWGWGCEQDVNKAIEYLETGVKAAEAFKEASALVQGVRPSQVTLKPNENLGQIYEILGHLYSYKGAREKAHLNYTELAKVNSDGDLQLANYYFARKENSKARGHLEAAVKKRNPIALRAWIKCHKDDGKKKFKMISRPSEGEYKNTGELKSLFRALNIKIQANKLKSLLERIESGNLAIKALPLLWPHYFFGHGCKQDYFLAALCYAIPYITRHSDILQELNFSNVKDLASLFRSWGENKEKDAVVLKLQELAKKTIIQRMKTPYETKSFKELFQKALEGDANARSCLGHGYMLEQDGEREVVQPNFQKAAVAFYVANGKKDKLWGPLFKWLAINDVSESCENPFITRFLRAREANWLLPENRHKESEKVDTQWIQVCENLGEMGYPIGWYKAGKRSMEYAPSYASACLSQVEACHPKLDALRARLYFTAEGIFGVQENGVEKPKKKKLRREKALGYWENVTTNGQGKVQREAQYYAGVCHLQGWGTKINAQRAIELLNLAKANGYQPNDQTISNFKKKEILEFYKNIPTNKPEKSRFLFWM